MLRRADPCLLCSLRWTLYPLYVPWGGSFITHVFSRESWLPSSTPSFHICLWGPDSLVALEVLIPSSRCLPPQELPPFLGAIVVWVISEPFIYLNCFSNSFNFFCLLIKNPCSFFRARNINRLLQWHRFGNLEMSTGEGILGPWGVEFSGWMYKVIGPWAIGKGGLALILFSDGKI